MRIPTKELQEAITDLSSGALKLLLFYFGCEDNFNSNSVFIAKSINTSERQFKKYKKELIDKRYLLISKGKTNVYFIGQGAVKKFMSDDIYDSNDEEPKDPLVTKGSKNEK